MLPFWISIGALSLVQGALVAVPGARAGARAGGESAALAWIGRLGTRAWAAIPAASVLAFVIIARAAAHASAQTLTYLALGAVPLLAALALGWLVGGARRAYVLLVPALFALAWVDRGGLAGELAAVLLAALTAALALGLDFLFLFVSELPATVPVALCLLVLAARGHLGDLRGSPMVSRCAAPSR